MRQTVGQFGALSNLAVMQALVGNGTNLQFLLGPLQLPENNMFNLTLELDEALLCPLFAYLSLAFIPATREVEITPAEKTDLT